MQEERQLPLLIVSKTKPHIPIKNFRALSSPYIKYKRSSYHICVCFYGVLNDTHLVSHRASVPAAVEPDQGTTAVVACKSAIDTPQALLVQAPDEVSTQVTPRGLSVAAGLEVVTLSLLLGKMGVLAAAQNSDDAHTAQQVWDLARADPQSVGSLQARRRAW